MMRNRFILAFLFFTVSIEIGISQQYLYQDSTKYPIELGHLEKVLFPLEDMKYTPESKPICGEFNKPVYLIQRPNLNPVDTIVEYIRRVFFLKDTTLLPEIIDLYYRYLDYFQAEWGWALIKHRACQKFKKQIEILEAFERAAYGLTLRFNYPDANSYYNFIRYYCEAQSLPVYYKIINRKGVDSTGLIHSLGEDIYFTIRNYDPSIIETMKELIVARRYSEYTKRLQQKYNVFGGMHISWNIFSPFLDEIKPMILNDYYDYIGNRNNKSYQTYIQRSFFLVHLRQYDYTALGISKPKD